MIHVFDPSYHFRFIHRCASKWYYNIFNKCIGLSHLLLKIYILLKLLLHLHHINMPFNMNQNPFTSQKSCSATSSSTENTKYIVCMLHRYIIWHLNQRSSHQVYLYPMLHEKVINKNKISVEKKNCCIIILSFLRIKRNVKIELLFLLFALRISRLYVCICCSKNQES